jgi:hypothetical protein
MTDRQTEKKKKERPIFNFFEQDSFKKKITILNLSVKNCFISKSILKKM